MSETQTLGWGLVGTGNIAKLMAKAVAADERATLANVVTRDPAKGAAFAAEYGVAAHSTSLEQLLADAAVDVVYISTPNVLHAPQAIAALQAGKHVLVEKPMALSLAEGEGMVAAARAAGRQLGLGFHLRYHPAHRELRRRVRSGEVGEVTYVRAEWGSNTPLTPDLWHGDPVQARFGSMSGIGVHLLDLVRWLIDDEVVEVVARDDQAAHPDTVEYLSLATLRFARGALAHVVSSRRMPFTTQSVVVHATGARLEGRGTLSVAVAGELVVTDAGGETTVPLELSDLYTLEARAFGAAVRGGEPFAATGADGLRSMALLEAIEAAAAAPGTAVAEPTTEGA